MYIDSESPESPLSSSWADHVTEELGIETQKTFKKITDTDTIISLNYATLSDLTILEHQVSLAGYLRKNIKNDKFKKKLEWLMDSTKWLSDKFNLPEYKHKETKHAIPRSSYKFCNYNFECDFNYATKKGCYAQHFVYNLVYADIKAILDYISTNKVVQEQEIKKSLNTVSYVITHMHDELKNSTQRKTKKA
jgi:hypothetical protein